MPDIESIYRCIEAHQAEHLAKLQDFVRQPSISAEDYGVKECAELLRQYYVALGCQEAELAPTDGHPGVWAYYDAASKKTLVVYCMYDVQPVVGENWSVPPFGGSVVEMPPFGKVLMSRGAYNSKGPFIFLLNALESIIAVEGTLPVNIMFISEGEEELGSPHFHQIIERYAGRLKQADAVIFPWSAQNPQGKATVSLGNKGIVYLELECSGKAWGRGPKEYDVHSSFKAITDSPAWRLIHALSTMTTPDGNRITIDGWYDKVSEPSEEDVRLVEELAKTFDDSGWKDILKVDCWIDDVKGKEMLLRYLFSTTLNIDGIWGGYTGPGSKTVLPHKVTCKVDVRLVPNQEPEDVVPLIRRHLDKIGCSDIEVRQLSGYTWSRTPLSAPIVQSLLHVYRKYGVETQIFLTAAGSAPMYLFTRKLGLPEVGGGLGHGGRAHSPDEYLVVEGNDKVAGMVSAEKFYVDWLFAFAEWEEGA